MLKPKWQVSFWSLRCWYTGKEDSKQECHRRALGRMWRCRHSFLVGQPEWMRAAPGSCVHKGNRDPWEHPWLTPTLIYRVNDVVLTQVHSLLFVKKYFLFFYRIPIKMKFVLFRFQVVTNWYTWVDFMSSFSFIFPLGKIHPSLPAVQGKIFFLAIREELSSFLPWFLSFSLLFCFISVCYPIVIQKKTVKFPIDVISHFFISGGEAFWQTFDGGTFLPLLKQRQTLLAAQFAFSSEELSHHRKK